MSLRKWLNSTPAPESRPSGTNEMVDEDVAAVNG